MRFGVTRELWAALMISGFAAGDGRSDPVDDATDKIAALVGQLGADTFAQREEASKALADLGESALPAVRKATAMHKHKELEIRARAAVAILAIMRGANTSISTGLRLSLIEAGEFGMGSDARDAWARRDELAHGVRITRPFLLGIHEVTQDQYRRVMKAEPSGFSKGGDREERIEGMDTGRFPVERVSWFYCIEFCNRLSRLDGYAPCYEMTEVKRQGDSISEARVTIAGGNG